MRLPYELREAELEEQQYNDEGQTVAALGA